MCRVSGRNTRIKFLREIFIPLKNTWIIIRVGQKVSRGINQKYLTFHAKKFMLPVSYARR